MFDETHTPGEAVHETPNRPKTLATMKPGKKKKKKSIKTLQKKEAIIRNSKKRTKTLGQQEPGRAGYLLLCRPEFCFAVCRITRAKRKFERRERTNKKK